MDELTLALDKATRAGLLREAYQGLEIKRDKISEDKTTHLDYTKAIADLQGLNKQKVEHSGTIVQIIDNIPNTKADENKT